MGINSAFLRHSVLIFEAQWQMCIAHKSYSKCPGIPRGTPPLTWIDRREQVNSRTCFCSRQSIEESLGPSSFRSRRSCPWLWRLEPGAAFLLSKLWRRAPAASYPLRQGRGVVGLQWPTRTQRMARARVAPVDPRAESARGLVKIGRTASLAGLYLSCLSIDRLEVERSGDARS
jgi:hypothetical protein